jgi:antirestriction protein
MVSNENTSGVASSDYHSQESVYFRVDATQSVIKGFLCNASQSSVEASTEIVESMKLQLDIVQANLELNGLKNTIDEMHKNVDYLDFSTHEIIDDVNKSLENIMPELLKIRTLHYWLPEDGNNPF